MFMLSENAVRVGAVESCVIPLASWATLPLRALMELLLISTMASKAKERYTAL